jgi:hypothetical protein
MSAAAYVITDVTSMLAATEPSAFRTARMVCITIGSPIDLLVLERLHEALRLCVVVRIADAAGLDVVGREQSGVIAAGILYAAIGVMDQAAGRGAACSQRHGEGRGGRTRLQVAPPAPSPPRAD